MKPNTHYNGRVCKANIGRNTLLHLQYWRGLNQYLFSKDLKPSIHDIINARSINIVSTLKPFNF